MAPRQSSSLRAERVVAMVLLCSTIAGAITNVTTSSALAASSPAPTTLVYTGPSDNDKFDPLAFSAVLTDTASGLGIPNAAITFSSGDSTLPSSCTATTGADGRATCTVI